LSLNLLHFALYCNEPLPRAGSSVSSARLLARPSSFGDGQVLAGAFPFISASRFNDGIATTKQQTMSIYFIKQSKAKTDDDVTTTAVFCLIQLTSLPPLPYSPSDLHVQFFIRQL
ncbi:hypothetical protein T4A_13195, partial [Trichinella pseudospiralis]